MIEARCLMQTEVFFKGEYGKSLMVLYAVFLNGWISAISNGKIRA